MPFDSTDTHNPLFSPLKLLAILLPAALLPFTAIIYHFLFQGAYFLDSGYFAYLLAKADLVMTNPPVLGPGQYMATHVSPSFWPMQYFAKMFGILPHVALGLWQALIFMGMALAGVLFIERSQLDAKVRHSRWTFFAALLLPFSGLALSILIYPHTEAMAMSGLFLCFALWLEDARWAHGLAWVIFVFTLGVREDVGFHVFGLLMTFLVLAWWSKQIPEGWKRLLLAALLGFVYSLAILKFQKANFNGDDAFARIYSGQPAWAHLSFEFLTHRLLEMLTHKPYLSVPAVIYMIYAARKKQILMAVPLLAYVPWVLVNLSAVAPTAGSLMSYYAYPLLALFIWPLVMLRLQAGRLSGAEQRGLVLFCVGMLAVSILGFRSAMGRRLFHWMNPVHLALLFDGSYDEHKCAVENFLKVGSGSKIMGQQFSALFPAAYSKTEVFFEPHEAVQKDYVMIWKNGYFIDKFEEEPGIRENFEKHFSDESVNVIWKRKNAPEPAVNWGEVFAPCRESKMKMRNE